MAFQVMITTVHTASKELAVTVQTEEEAEAMAQILNEHISMRVLDPTIPSLSYVVMTDSGIVINQG